MTAAGNGNRHRRAIDHRGNMKTGSVGIIHHIDEDASVTGQRGDAVMEHGV